MPMRSDSLASIRVDQSHCNYYLAQHLVAAGWSIHFIDPGRSSRGGTGNQGKCLNLWECNGLPIPDIAASKDGTLLLVEIDRRIPQALPSLTRYRQASSLIISATNEILAVNALEELQLAFCKTGITPSPDVYLERALDEHDMIDLIAVFRNARDPVCKWRA